VDRLNRSLTGLSAQVCQLHFLVAQHLFDRSQVCQLHLFQSRSKKNFGRFLSAGGLACRFFFNRSHPAGRVRLLFFVLSVCCRSAGSARAIFLSGRFSTAVSERQNLLFEGSPVSSCACRNLFSLCPVTSLLRAQNLFFVEFGQQLVCMQNLFFLSGHFSAGRAQFFLDASQNFSFAQFFFLCRPVSSAQTLGFDFFLAHGISVVYFFRILRQKFDFFLASSLCCFWFSDHTGQNQLNWPMGAVELVLRTSSTAYIYLTLPFSSPTSFTLALVASQPLEPLFHTPQPVHSFTTFFNHGASSQPLCD
jgi:hypothetical protein